MSIRPRRAVLALLALSACDAPAPTATATVVPGGGSVRFTVTWHGTLLAERRPIAIDIMS